MRHRKGLGARGRQDIQFSCIYDYMMCLKIESRFIVMSLTESGSPL